LQKAIGRKLVGLKLLWCFGEPLNNIENVKDFGIILNQNLIAEQKPDPAARSKLVRSGMLYSTKLLLKGLVLCTPG
jgi:hypothetical protein